MLTSTHVFKNLAFKSMMRKGAAFLFVLLVGVPLISACSVLDSLSPTATPFPIEAADIQIGRVAAATGIDRDGCPVGETNSFAPTDQVYIVADNSNVPIGTDIFARLFLNDQPVEDSVVITADQDYTNTCIYFEFEATSSAGSLQTGNYEAQVIVNGNPGPSVDFIVQ